MNTFLSVLFVLSVLCLIAGLSLEWLTICRSSRQRRTRLSTVCMECGRLISGPFPRPGRPISHGLCRACATRWRAENITRQPATPIGSVPFFRSTH